MAFDIEGARDAGYSDQDISSYLADKHGFDLTGAVKAGHSTTDILNYLIQKNESLDHPHSDQYLVNASAPETSLTPGMKAYGQALGRGLVPKQGEARAVPDSTGRVRLGKEEADDEPSFVNDVVGGTAKDVLGVAAKVGAGAVRGATLGAINPEEGTIGIPFTDRKAQVTPPLSQTLQEKAGVSEDIAENPYLGIIGDFAGITVPWGATSKAITKGVELGRGLMAGKELATGAEAVKKGSLVVDLLKGAAERTAIQGATGAAIGAAEVRNPGESMSENALSGAKWGAGLNVIGEGINAIALAKGALKYKAYSDLVDTLGKWAYGEGRFDDLTQARKWAAQTVTDEINNRGGWEKVSRGEAKKTADVISRLTKEKPSLEPTPVNMSEPADGSLRVNPKLSTGIDNQADVDAQIKAEVNKGVDTTAVPTGAPGIVEPIMSPAGVPAEATIPKTEEVSASGGEQEGGSERGQVREKGQGGLKGRREEGQVHDEKGVQVAPDAEIKPGPQTEAPGSVPPTELVKTDIDKAAHEAATSPVNDLPAPTEAQIEAGNYKKGHINIHGLDISIENPKGSVRSGTSPDGKEWSTTLNHHYGYIKGTEGRDGDHVDVFVGDNPGSEKAYVVNQINPKTGKFDEHKVLLGFNSYKAAREGYLSNYEKNWKGVGSMVPMSIDRLKTWLEKGDTHKPVKALEKKDEAETKGPVAGTETPVPETTEPPVEKEKYTDETAPAAVETWEATPEGAGKRQTELNKESFERAKEWGFNKEVLDAGGWGHYPFPHKERISLSPPSKGRISFNSIQLAQGPNGRWASDYSITLGDGGSSSSPNIYNKGFDTKREAVLSAIKKFKDDLLARIEKTGQKDKAYGKKLLTELDEIAKKAETLVEDGENAVEREEPVKAEPHEETGAEKEVPEGATEKPKEVEAEAPKEEPGDATEPREKEVGAAEEKKPRVKKEKGEKKSRPDKLKDAGEKMAGKRSHKDDFAKLATGNKAADLKRLLAKTAKPELWPVRQPEAASPGTARYLKSLRDKMDSFTEWAGKKVGGSKGRTRWSFTFNKALENHVTSNDDGYSEVEKWAVEYADVMTVLSDATKGEVSVIGAETALKKLLINDEYFDKQAKEGYVSVFDYLTEAGKSVSAVSRDFIRAVAREASGAFLSDEGTVIAEQKKLIRPRLENVERTDLPERRPEGKDATGDDLIKEFGFRGVEFGEWVNSRERQLSTNLAFDSFYDLAEALGMPKKGISAPVHNGSNRLGMAFGSRGSGSAAAHYEPGNHVINLTKTKGDGALSHEWGHAFDKMLSSTTEGRAAVKDVVAALNQKINLEAAEKLVKEILGGGHWLSRTHNTPPIETARLLLQGKWEDYVIEATEFQRQSKGLGDYWDKDEEKFARAFEAYVYDKLGGSNPYLVSDWVDGNTTKKDNGYKGNPYPSGEERQIFRDYFDHFFSGLEWGEDGRPFVKKDHVRVMEAQKKKAQEYFDKLIQKLEDMYNALHQGEASPDGLWWYYYHTTRRGPMLQPKGYVAFHDKYEGENVNGGRGAIAYSEPMRADDVLAFDLKPFVLQDPESVVYLTRGGENGGTDSVRADGEETLGDVEAQDGGRAKGKGSLSGGPSDRAGDGEEGVDKPDRGGATGRNVHGDSEAGGVESVHTTAGREEGADTGPGPDAVSGAGNYRITERDRLGEGTLEDKFFANVSAIKLLQQIESEGRKATAEEQAVLVKYVGWGGMSKAFDYYASGPWSKKNRILTDLLTDEEYRTASRSTQYAFYTPQVAIKAMYDALERLGFKGGRILEPATGIGHFFGLLPEKYAHSKLTGVEMDSISARLAKQLYQDAAVYNSKYEEAKLPKNFFDLAISNVPFSATVPYDKQYNKEGLVLHDFYFNKSLELVRPGGIVAFITSTGTMDKLDKKAREVLSKKADFIGAIRIPGDIYWDTDAANDIVFLRRKTEGDTSMPERAWVETGEVKTPSGEAISVNKYFVENPSMVLGEMGVAHTQFGERTTVKATGGDIADKLREAITALPEGVYKELKWEPPDPAKGIPAPDELKDGSFAEKDGKLYVNNSGVLEEVPEKTPMQKAEGKIIRDMIPLRTLVRKLLRSQMLDEGDAAIESLQKQMNKAYDGFVKEHGYLNSPKVVRAIVDDPEAPRVLALEKWDEDAGKAVKSDIFTKKFIESRKPVDHVDNPADAVPHSLNNRGRLDLDYMSELTGIKPDQLTRELEGQIYNDPEQGWVTSDDYLSGNVRAKLEVAKMAAESDKSFENNVKALEAVQPADLVPSQIHVRLGGSWVSPEYIRQFIGHLIPSASNSVKVDHVKELSMWNISFRAHNQTEADRRKRRATTSIEANATWGTRRTDFFELMNFALNGGVPKIYDTVRDADGGEKKVLNQVETEAAQAKLNEIQDRFSEWVWENPERSQGLVRTYNDEFNNTVPRKYDGSHLTFPGKISDTILALMKHQRDVVWRALSTHFNTYLAHEVGTGKTFAMAAIAMEAKRLGLKKKPLLLGLNANVNEVAADIIKLYPGANVLRLDISGDRIKRKIQLNRIATNDWDAVVINHDSFSRIKMSPQGQAEYIGKMLQDHRAALIAAKAQDASKSTVKEIEKRIERLENSIKKLADIREPEDIYFEELGADLVLVDEAHEFKNLSFATAYRGIKGINPEGSGMATDLHMKALYLHNKYSGGLILASGTPVTNSVGELYTVSRYLQPEELMRRGLNSFDAWAHTFGDIGQTLEYAPQGGGYNSVTKFNKFINIPELSQMVRQVMDVVKADDTGVKRPGMLGGKPIPIVVPQNEGVKLLHQELKERVLAIKAAGKNHPPHPRTGKPDIMLTVINDGRLGSIDMRLVDPAMSDYEDTKPNYAVKNVLKHYEESKDIKGAQLVFADLGVPNGKKEFNVYDDIKKKLVAGGIPEKEIAFIQDYTGKAQEKKRLFRAVRGGKIRVLLGSTGTMGTGVNVQDRIVAMHHLDTNWHFGGLDQRNGRGIRQGNILFDLKKGVATYYYSTKETVDAFMWDKVASKKVAVDQIMLGDPTVREIEDISQDTMSANEMVAVTSGNPLIAEKVRLETDVRKLSNLKKAYLDKQYTLKTKAGMIPAMVQSNFQAIEASKKDGAVWGKVTHIKLEDGVFDLKKDTKEINDQVKKLFLNAIKEKNVNVGDPRLKAVIGSLGTAVEKGEGKDKTLEWKQALVTLYVRKSLDDNVLGGRTSHGEREIVTEASKENHILGPNRLLAAAEKRIEAAIEGAKESIKNLEEEKVKIEAELAKPFDKADELETKNKRLTEVSRELVKMLSEKDNAAPPDVAKYYYARTTTGEWHKVDGNPQDLGDGIEGFSYKEINGKWVVAEARSGMAIARGATEAEAVAEALSRIEARGAERVKEILEKSIQENGHSPRYASNNTVKEEAASYTDKSHAKIEDGLSEDQKGDGVEKKNEKIAKEALEETRSRELSVAGRDNLGRRQNGNGGIRTTGVGISAELEKKGYIDLRGRKVETPEEMAVLAQVYRNPKFETLRYFYVKDGVIVGHEGRTSRVPGQVVAFDQGKEAREVFEIRNRMSRLGADGFWLIHNHPSGNPMPSENDRSFTVGLASKIPGFKGHVIINSGKYATLIKDSNGIIKEEMKGLAAGPDLLLSPSIEHPLLGRTLANANNMVDIGKELKEKKGFMTVLYRGSDKKVRAIQEVPVGLANTSKALTDYLRGRAREFGAPEAIIISTEKGNFTSEQTKNIHQLVRTGVLKDALIENPETSVRDGGEKVMVNNTPHRWMNKNVVANRVSEDSVSYEAEEPESPAQAVAQSPRNPFGKLRDKVLNPLGMKDPDLSKTEALLSLPWWLGKKHKEFHDILEVELTRQENRENMLHELLRKTAAARPGEKDIHEFLALPRKEADDLFKVIVRAGEDNITYLGPQVEKQKGDPRPYLQDMAKELLGKELTDKQVAAYYAWKKTMDRSLNLMFEEADRLNFLPYEGRPWFDDLKAVTNGEKELADVAPGLSEAELSDFRKALDRTDAFAKTIHNLRKQMGRIKFYVPRIRENGKYVVKVFGEDDALIWREHASNQWRGAAIKKSLSERFPNNKITVSIEPPTPESLYQAVSEVAIERFMDESMKKLRKGESIANENLEAFKDAMVSAITEHLKERGFGRHMIKRLPGSAIGGYKTEEGQQILLDYLSGLTGFITKQEAAIKYSEVLQTIPLNKPVLFEETSNYVKDMLRNSTDLDKWSGKARSLAFAYYLAGNLKSAAVQFSQNFITGMPALARETKFADAKYAKAMKDVTLGGVAPGEEAQALHQAFDRGITRAQYIDEVRSRLKNTMGKLWDNVIEALSVPFSAMETFNRKSAFLAMFRVARNEQKLPYDEAFKKARDLVYDTHYLMGKANLPSLARGGTSFSAVARTSYTFRSFNHNYLLSVYDAIRRGPDGKRNLAFIGRSLAWLTVFGGITAIPFLDDALDTLEKLTGEPYRREIKDLFRGMGGSILEKVGSMGVPALLDINISGSLKIGLPALGSASENVYGVYSGLEQKAARGFGALGTGQYERAAEAFSPVFAENLMKAGREYSSGMTNLKGHTMFDEGEPVSLGPGEAIAQGAGFSPARIAAMNLEKRVFTNIESHFAGERNTIYTEYRTAKDDAGKEKALDKLRAYNDEVARFKGAIPRITADDLRNQLKERPDKKFLIFEQKGN